MLFHKKIYSLFSRSLGVKSELSSSKSASNPPSQGQQAVLPFRGRGLSPARYQSRRISHHALVSIFSNRYYPKEVIINHHIL